MNKITQTVLFRQALINYAQEKGVTKAAIRYKTNRQYIYRRMKRYDGTLESLEERSHRPHSHPNQHTPEELKLIAGMRRRKPKHKLGRILGKAYAKRLYTLRNKPLQGSSQNR